MTREILFPMVLMFAGMAWSAENTTNLGTREINPYAPPTSDGVKLGDDGRLIYEIDGKGNRLPDFSYVGYHAGEKQIPNVAVIETLTPVDGDNTAAIQSAIERVGMRKPDKDGLKGAILLKRGVYHIEGSLSILHSGVVLRGEGNGKDGTTLVAAGHSDPKYQRDLIIIGNDAEVVLNETSKRAITDDYVPVGTRTFSVESTDGYKVGDRIILYRPSTAAWISFIGMDSMRSKFKEQDGIKVDVVKQWQAGEYDFRFERIITEIKENRITIDAPVMHVLDAKYGGGAIYHYDVSDRVFEIGVEDLSVISEFGEAIDGNPYGDPEMLPTSFVASQEKAVYEHHSWTAIRAAKNSEDIWIRRVTGNYFCRSLVYLEGSRATVQDCVNLGHASKITGRRRYSFVTTGQMNLFQRCVTRNGRHEFVTNARTTGPNVFVDCLGVDCVASSGCGPHSRYSVGCLFDNIKSESQMESTNYGSRGTGHGWAGAQIAFYNCVAPMFMVSAPPGGACWVIGGRADDDPVSKMAKPRSLYLKQLEERLGKEIYERTTIEAQRSGTIYDMLMKRLDEQ